MDLHELINHPEASIVDVRTPGEFNEGHLEGTVNIPLDQVEERLDEFKKFSTPLILCCRSGMRSRATEFLKAQGLSDAHNGGGWTDVRLLVVMGWLQRLFGDGTDWAELIENRKAQIVDVRSPGEYRSGHLKNSMNIPLDQLKTKAGKLDKQRPVIACCASGVRSRMG